MTDQTLTTRRQSLSEHRVMRAMHPGVLACSPDAPVSRVAELMAAYAVHVSSCSATMRTARRRRGA